MTLENEAPDESAFFSPDDPTSEAEDIAAQNAAETTDEAAEGDENADAESGDENQEQADNSEDEEFEEIEHSGKKFKLPKELKPLLMMQQDYTRKTQEVSEQRRALQEHAAKVQADLQQQVQLAQTFTREIAQIHSIDERLEQYSKVDWRAWENQDFIAANAGWKEWQMLKDQRAQVVQSIQQKEHQVRQEQEKRSREAQQAQEQELAKRREETFKTVKSAIPSWNEEVAGKVSEYAMRHGYSREELIQATTDPRAFILLHKAWRGEQLEAQQKAAAQKAKAQIQPQPKPLTPVAKGKPAPATAGLDDRLSADEWVRRRNEQLRSRA